MTGPTVTQHVVLHLESAKERASRKEGNLAEGKMRGGSIVSQTLVQVRLAVLMTQRPFLIFFLIIFILLFLLRFYCFYCLKIDFDLINAVTPFLSSSRAILLPERS